MPTIPKGQRPPWVKSSPKPKSPDADFYGSGAWKKLRGMFIRANPACADCGRAANVVDHIVPIRDGGPRLDMANFQSLCHKCHNAKRGKESHQIKLK
jgi:5-methylcytosine-specific restriction endonuclease McrA